MMFYLLYKWLRKKYATPVSPRGLAKADHKWPSTAAIDAWMDAGDRPDWHENSKESVRLAMPLLARALDRWEEKINETTN